MFSGLIARLGLGLLFGRAKAIAAKVPWQVWALLGAVVLGWLAVRWHRSEVGDLTAEVRAAAIAERDAEWRAGFAEMERKAGIYKAGFLEVSAREARRIRSETDETLRRNAALAGDLRLRGPGHAAAGAGCRSFGAGDDSASADRPDPSGTAPDAPLAPVPDGERLALVPWLGTLRFAEQHDRLLAERHALIEHIDVQNRAIEELRAKLQSAVPAFEPDAVQPSQ